MTNYNKKYKCIKSYPKGPEIGRIFNPHKGWGYTLDWMKENPDLINEFFEEVIDWDALLEEAKRRYPIGTKIDNTNLSGDCTFVVKYANFKIDNNKILLESNHIDFSAYTVYKDGKWAEIIEPVFVTEDGISIYQGDMGTYWVVKKDYNIIEWDIPAKYSPSHLVLKRFSTKQAAEGWLEKNKPVELCIPNNSIIIAPPYTEYTIRINSKDSNYIDLISNDSTVYKKHCTVKRANEILKGDLWKLKENHITRYYKLSTIINNIEDCKNRVSISNGGDYIQTNELIERLKNDKTR